MPLTTGIEHVALVSKDIDALIDFYTDVFDAVVLFDLKGDHMRHAGIQVGSIGYLHPFEQPANQYAHGSFDGFGRGHLDHVSLGVADEETFDELRRRLVARGASDGTVTHWGICRELSYVDPDGCQGEISIWVGDAPRTWDQRGIEP
jgi:catechol 2,3-dioxygenase-like lactoylglutathione lyase family enzyme